MAGRRRDLDDRLAALSKLDDDSLPLAETALLLERGLAGPSLLERLDCLAASLDQRHDHAEDRAQALAELLFQRSGFRQNQDEADLMGLAPLLEHGHGEADALGVLWLETAWRAGWNAEALNFPGPLLVRLEAGRGERVVVDPGTGGAILQPPDLRAMLKAQTGLSAELAPCHVQRLSPRAILVRMQNEAKMRLLRLGRLAEAVILVEGILAVAPHEVRLWREAGLMHLRLDRLPQAIAALEQFVSRAGPCPERAKTALLLQDIRARLS